MKKLICALLCIALCGCVVSCSEEPEEVNLSSDNISDYVSVQLSFGEVGIADNETTIMHNEKYYLTCLATITIKPKGDYAFTNTSVWCVLNEGGGWTPLRTKKDKWTLADSLYDWQGSIQLDKEGYGETTVFLFCYSDTYDMKHPSAEKWECYVSSASGTVTEN